MRDFFKLFIAFALTLVMGFSVLNVIPTSAKAEEIDVNDPFSILASLDEVKGANDVNEEYRLDKTLDVAFGKVYKFLQVSGEYDVYGSDLIVSVDKDGNVLSVDGEYINIPSLNENLTQEDVLKVVAKNVGETNIYEIEKLIYALDVVPQLAYKVTVGDKVDGKVLYVSAASGKILKGFYDSVRGLSPISQVDGLGNTIEINVFHDENNGEYVMMDATKNFFLYDMQNMTSPSLITKELSIADDGSEQFDPIAVSAWNNMNIIYDFYADASNLGVSIVGADGNNDNVSGNCEPNNEAIVFIYIHYGEDYDNAYCSPDTDRKVSYIVIGDGAGDSYYEWNGNQYPVGSLKDPANALDILGHEYQHAVCAYITNFEYVGDSGALNEAFADIMGALIEGKTGDDFWGIGEDGSNMFNEHLRSMDGSTRSQRYDNANKQVCRRHQDNSEHDENCDYAGVHSNSTIISHVQYKMSQAMPEYFTNERIGHLWYSTLCTLSDNADFTEFTLKFIKAAQNLNFSQEAIQTIKECLTSSNLLTDDMYHTVTFYDWDGTELGSYEVLSGETLTEFPEEPSRESDNTYYYVFSGWDIYPVGVTQDLVITATYNVFYREYTVTILDMTNDVIQTTTHHFGDSYTIADLEEPASPGEYWIFEGFYMDNTYTYPAYDFTISEDVTLYAYWSYLPPPPAEEPDDSKNCGTVVFDSSNGGSGGSGLMIGFTLLAAAATIAFAKKKSKKQG